MLRDPTALYRISGRRLEQCNDLRSVLFFNMTAVGDEHGTGSRLFFELHHQKRFFNLALFPDRHLLRRRPDGRFFASMNRPEESLLMSSF